MIEIRQSCLIPVQNSCLILSLCTMVVLLFVWFCSVNKQFFHTLKHIQMMKSIIIRMSIKPLILIGPSGSGRSAIAFRLTSELPHKFNRVVSMTSRPLRPIQKQGYHFYFRSQQQMLKRNNNKEFVTFVLSPHNHYYGTQVQQLRQIMSRNRIPILKVTLDSYIKNIMSEMECHPLYINVPDMKQIESRLKYGPFSDEEISEKLKSAAEEQRQAPKYICDQNIIQNSNIEEALVKIKARLFELY